MTGLPDEDRAVGHPDAEDKAMTRRRFMAAVAVGGATGYALWALRQRGAPASVAPTTTGAQTATRPVAPATVPAPAAAPVEDPFAGLLAPAPVEQRVLVLIELEGGNDGPSTIVPYNSGTYYDLRPKLAIPAEKVLPINDEIGLNPNLTQLHKRQMAIVEGVGPVDGTLSHFEMVKRWELGDPGGAAGLRQGFLARLTDAIGGDGIVGLSVAGHTPRFDNATTATLSLTGLEQLRVLTRDRWIYPQYRQAVTSFEGGPMTTTMADSWNQLMSLGQALPEELEPVDREAPMVKESRRLGRQLATAAEMIRADVGVRVVHAHLNGFDTHKGHDYKHENLMKQLDVAIGGFLQKLDDEGLADRVLVATSSEFGRRGKENGSGLDHGAASTMLLFGPVLPGRLGQPSSLSDLDDTGNLKTHVPFDVYLGTLAEQWLGVEAASVLPSAPEVITLF